MSLLNSLKAHLGKLLILSLTCTSITVISCKNSDKFNKKSSSSSEKALPEASKENATSVTFELDVDQTLMSHNVTSVKVDFVCDDFSIDHDDNHPKDLLNGAKFTVYGEPTGCVVKLREFTVGNTRVFEEPQNPAKKFSNYQVGDKAVFTDHMAEINVRVITQLPSPLNKDFNVEYKISEMLLENSYLDLDIETNEVSVTIGNEPPPQLNLKRAKVVAFSPLMPGFELYIQCLKPVTSDDYATAKCVGHPLNEMLTVFEEVGPGYTPQITVLNHKFGPQGSNPRPQLWDAYFGHSFVEPSNTLPNGGVKIRIPFNELGLSKLSDLNGKRWVLTVKHPDGISYYNSILKKRPRDGCMVAGTFNFDPKATNQPEGACINPPACADWATFDIDAPWDGDCDGLKDNSDQCLDTEPGLAINGFGCSLYDLADLDNDGVRNSDDECFSKSPAGVGANGCSTDDVADGDGDGVINSNDLCRETVKGTDVGENGCSDFNIADVDNDNVNDFEDQCLTTAPGDTVNSQGCAAQFPTTDSDNDGIPDHRDECTSTGNGDSVAVNGCSLADYGGKVLPYDVIGSLEGKLSVAGGVGSYSVTLDVPTGTMGMQPQISAGYTGGTGHGVLGSSFALRSAGRIARCKNDKDRDGYNGIANPTYIKFCYNGTKLVREDTSDTYGASGTVYRLEKDNHTRLVSMNGSNTAPEYFVVFAPNGVVEYFGANSNSRTTTSGGANFEWHLTERVDRHGNNLKYSYTSIGTKNISVNTISYSGWKSVPSTTDGFLNYDSYSASPGYYTVKFNYANLPHERNMHNYGFRYTQNKYLQNMQVKNRNNVVIRQFNFTYETHHTIKRLISIQQVRGSKTQQPTSFTWSDDGQPSYYTTNDYLSKDKWGQNKDIFSDDHKWEDFNDVTGDGLMDYLFVKKGTNDLMRSLGVIDGNKFYFANPTKLVTDSALTQADGEHHAFLDINGDGFGDKVWVKEDNGYVVVAMINDKTGDFAASSTISSTTASTGVRWDSHDDKHWNTADVNGDGWGDIVWVPHDKSDKVYVSLFNTSNTTFNNPTVWMTQSGSDKVFSTDGLNEHFMDINGDKKADYLWVPDNQSSHYFVSLSSGSGFSSPTKIDLSGIGGAKGQDNTSTRLIDVNGDGATDRIWSPKDSGNSNLYVIYGYGNGSFSGATKVLEDSNFDSLPDSEDADNFTDLNQDGMSDLTWEKDDVLYSAIFNGKNYTDTVYASYVNPPGTTVSVPTITSSWTAWAADLVTYNTITYPQYVADLAQFVIDHAAWEAEDEGTRGVEPVTPSVPVDPTNSEPSKFGNSDLKVAVDEGENAFGLDVNSDGITDRVWFTDEGLTLQVAILRADLKRVEWITNGGGSRVSLAYKYPVDDTTGMYTKGTNSSWPVMEIIPAKPMVYSSTAFETNGDEIVTRYKYKGQKVHMYGVGPLGFEKETTYDDLHLKRKVVFNNLEYSKYSQGMPRIEYEQVYMGASANLSGQTFSGGQWRNTYRITKVYDTLNTTPNTHMVNQGSSDKNIYNYDKSTNLVISNTVNTNSMDPFSGKLLKTIRIVDDKVYGSVSTRTLDYFYTDFSDDYWLSNRISKLDDNFTVTESGSGHPIGDRSYSKSSSMLVYSPKAVVLKERTLTGAAAITMEYTFDKYGNKTSSRKTAWKAPTRTESAEYDADGRHMLKKTNQMGQVTEMEFHPDLGDITKYIDSNGLVKLTQYGEFGEKLLEIDHNGIWSASYARFCQGDSVCRQNSEEYYYIYAERADGVSGTDILDNNGRSRRSLAVGMYGDVIEAEEFYSKGRASGSIDAHLSSEAPVTNLLEYDTLSRLVKTTRSTPGESDLVRTRSYDGFKVTSINERGQQNSESVDALKQLRTIVDPKGSVTNMYYGDEGRPISVQILGHTTTIGYDQWGRRTSINDPDLGLRSFALNGFGEAIAHVDANGAVRCHVFDALGRLVKRVDNFNGDDYFENCIEDSPNDSLSTWEYDTHSEGQISAIRSPEYEKIYLYDYKGQVAGVKERIHTQKFNYGFNSDKFGRPVRAIYPTGFAVSSVYGDFGKKISIVGDDGKVYWHANKENGMGKVTEDIVGNSIKTTYNYNRFMNKIKSVNYTGGGITKPYNYSMIYDKLGNQTKRTFDSSVGPIEENFTYDNLNRLVTFNYETHKSGQINYAANGNIDFMTGVGAYSYGGTCNGIQASDHAVTATSGDKNWSLCYDKNGNMTTRGDRSIEYTDFNKPYLVDKGTDRSIFTYETDRKLMRRVDVGNVNRTTFYVSGLYELVYEENKYIHKFYLNGNVIVKQEDDGEKEDFYLHKDNMGSVIAMSDPNGGIVERLHYDAWGKRLDYSFATNARKDIRTAGYTGHEQLEQFDLIHMGGRIYDPVLARFLNPDPVVQDFLNSQNFNRYTYVLNNPNTFTDPTGHSFWDDVGNAFKDAGNAIGGAFESLGNAIVSGLSDAWDAVKSVANDVANWFATDFLDGLKDFGNAVWDATLGNATFIKVLTIIGTVLEIGLGVAALITGILTGNPLLAAAGVFLINHGIDATVAAATGGDSFMVQGIAYAIHGVSYALNATLNFFGADVNITVSMETAMMVALVVDIVISVVVGFYAGTAITNAFKGGQMALAANRMQNAGVVSRTIFTYGVQAMKGIAYGKRFLRLTKVITALKVIGKAAAYMAPVASEGVYRYYDARGESLFDTWSSGLSSAYANPAASGGY
jgi:RHS repeat-associated protein